MADVAMPRLSDSMEEGTILKWLKSDGDEVSRGEELVEIETDKANMTYESDTEGVLKIVAQEGDTLPVGETIAQIGGGDGGGGQQGEESAPQQQQDDAEQEQEQSPSPRVTRCRRPRTPSRTASRSPRRSPRLMRRRRPRTATAG